ncbi:MAG: hypothetical protein ACO23K_01210 [Ilumatobacteraceae bacterium]
MAIYGYKSPDGKTHWKPCETYVSLGYNHLNDKHYLFIEPDTEIPAQPEEIGWSVITDSEELDSVAQNCPAFFQDRGAAKAQFGIE